MENLIIGLIVGVASALVLVVMWRMAERLRRELRAEAERVLNEKPGGRLSPTVATDD